MAAQGPEDSAFLFDSDSDSFLSALSTPRSWTSSPSTTPLNSPNSITFSDRGGEISPSGFPLHDDCSRRSQFQIPTRRKVVNLSSSVKAEDVIHEIQQKRDTFFAEKRDTILPLLADKMVFQNLDGSPETRAATILPYKMLECQPAGLVATLKPYQLEGLSFLLYLRNNGIGGILGDEMGLGKTIQTLALFQHIKENELHYDVFAPFLVVCPLSILENWVSEIAKFTPNLRAVRYHGSPDQKASIKKILKPRKRQKHCSEQTGKVDILITTYDTLISDIVWFQRAFIWRYVVLDEGHRIKNSSSKRAQALRRIRSEYKLVLTGTPVQNNLSELWSIFHWIYPEVFIPSSKQLFEDAFSLRDGKFDGAFLDQVKKFLGLIMLRRVKESPEIGIGLPPKTEIALSVPISEMQRSSYLEILTGIDPLLSDKMDQSQECSQKRYRIPGNILMELRKCSIHPYLLDHAIPDPYELGAHIVANSGKFIVLHKLIQHYVISENRKVIIFSGFEQALNLCEDLLVCHNLEHVRLDGRTSSAWRNLSIYLFNNDPRCKVFLISIRAGGEGLNLTSSSTVIFLDEDWNPQVMRQAESRVHRLGQTEPVTIFKLYSKGTVEEQMSHRIFKKAYVAAKVLDNGCDRDGLVEMVDSESSDINADLLTALIQGKSSVSRDQIDLAELAKWDLETLLEKCADNSNGPELRGAITAGEEKAWLERVERVKTNLFNGMTVDTSLRYFSMRKETTAISVPRSDRRIGKNRTVIIDGYEVCKESLKSTRIIRRDPSSADKNMDDQDLFLNDVTCFLCDKFHPAECSVCPRAFHADCLESVVGSGHYNLGRLICPHHYCCQCQKAASQVGQLLFCCKRCQRAYCEQCLDWPNTTFIGRNHSYEALGYSPRNAFYVECVACKRNGKRKCHSRSESVDATKRTRF